MGEFELLARVRERIPAPAGRVRLGSGDDAAVTVPGGATATSVDALVEGVHFSRETATLRQIGAKALATALSDLAAMGAEPGEAYVVLTVPDDLDEDGCLEALDGMLELASATGTTLAGGDITRGPVLAFSCTVVGHASAPGLFVHRDGARPGDALVLTGELGAAAAGLLLADPERRRPRPARAGRREPASPPARADSPAGRRPRPGGRRGAGDDRHQRRPRRRRPAISPRPAGWGCGSRPRRCRSRRGWRRSPPRPAETRCSWRSPAARTTSCSPRCRRRGWTWRRLGAASGVEVTRIGEVVAGEGVEIRLPGGRTLEPSGFDQLG